MGRGGAVVARASDPSALMHNVAGIAGLAGFQLTLSSNYQIVSTCYTRAGVYESNVNTTGTVFEDSTYNNGTTAYPEQCKSGPYGTVAPQLLATWRFHPRWALGLGAYGPNATGSRQTFDDRVTLGGGTLAPSPLRNMIYEKTILLFHVTMAIAWSPVPWLRVGAALQPSFASFGTTTMANGSPTSAQSPATDTRTRIETSGWFLAGNLGVQVLPSRYLALGLGVHLTTTAVLTGSASATANYYAPMASRQVHSTYSVDRMTVPFPFQARLGARFVLPRRGRPTLDQPVTNAREGYDPMTDDVFDIELDGWYEGLSRMAAIGLENSGRIDIGGTTIPAPARVNITSNFNDVYGVRLGGDYNVLPGRLALRAGVAYETAGMSNEFAQIHVGAYQTTSVHGGASLRLGFLTMSVGYAHFFMADFVADRGQRSIVSAGGPLEARMCTATSSGPDACTTNRGTYRASLDILHLGFNARF
jgi:hypothetical protein